MRYYNIDEINKSCDSKNKWKFPIIFAVLSLVITASIVVAGVYAYNNKMAEATNNEEEEILKAASTYKESIDLGDTLRQSTVNEVVKGERIKSYTASEIRKMDVSKPSGVTVADLKLVTRGNFVGLEEVFWQAEQDYGINCLFVMAIGANESAFGKICFRKNNMFGFGRKGYATKADNINAVAKTLATRYLKPGASLYHGKTVDGVHKSYAASPVWDDHVIKYMVQFYSKISANHNAVIDKLK
ncbi:MAG: glucosaminidase domain-containing protein [Bacillota bacterium]|nr:glucosaminidase domain-containing protein [Bacillota bacterium]